MGMSFNRRLAVGVAAALAPVALAAAPPMPTSEEITRSELTDRKMQPAPIARWAAVSYPVQYHFQSLALQMEQEALRGRSDVFTAGANAADFATVIRSTQIGWSSAVNDIKVDRLVMVSIAFEVLGSLFGEKSDRDRLLEGWQELQSPSLYVVSVRKPSSNGGGGLQAEPMANAASSASGADSQLVPEPSRPASGPTSKSVRPAKRQPLAEPTPEMVASVDQVFDEGAALVRALNLGCESAHTKSINVWGNFIIRGDYIPGLLHNRGFVCGHEGKIDIGVGKTRGEGRQLLVQSIGRGPQMTEFDDGTVAVLNLSRIDKMEGLVALLDPDSKVDPQMLPRVLYERIKEKLGTQWTAVFTSPGASSQRVVVVAREGSEHAFVIPKRP